MPRATAAALFLAATLAGCGFQLRGTASLPYKSIWIGVPETSSLGAELKRNIRNLTSTAIEPDPAKAQARLDILTEAREKDVLSLNSQGQVREYTLRYRMAFRVRDAKDGEYVPRTELVLKRDISFNENQLLAKEAEETMLYRDMQTDLVQQVLRRLAVARPQ